MDDPTAMVGWPPDSAFVLARVTPEGHEAIVGSGNLFVERVWASVTKFAVAFGAAREVGRASDLLERPAGPPGATVAHLLAHASGLGAEEGDPTMGVGLRRIYSNVGFDQAAAAVARGDLATWFSAEVAGPLGLGATLRGRASSGAVGSVNDLAVLGAAWCAGRQVDPSVRDRFTTPFLPDLVGVVPGFGRFDPCPWGLGPEVHGHKHHWMGATASSAAYGHFGRSGTLVLVDPPRDLVLAAAAGAPFGPWAVERWPRWVDDVVGRADA